MANRKLKAATASLIAQARANNWSLDQVLEDPSASWDIHAYCGQYARDTQCETYRAAYDRICTYIERALRKGESANATNQ